MKASRAALLFLPLLAAITAGTGAAWAHATLQSATPAQDAQVAAPREIILRFNEKLEAAFSNAKVVDGSGKAMTSAQSTLDAADPAVMRMAVPALAPGKYTVQFVAVGHDGHRRKGSYSFTVK